VIYSALQIERLHLVALGGICDLGFLVILGDCHHLDGLVLVEDH
jgi:hypothetical protein